jgi:hypothetical protein
MNVVSAGIVVSKARQNLLSRRRWRYDQRRFQVEVVGMAEVGRLGGTVTCGTAWEDTTIDGGNSAKDGSSGGVCHRMSWRGWRQ